MADGPAELPLSSPPNPGHPPTTLPPGWVKKRASLSSARKEPDLEQPPAWKVALLSWGEGSLRLFSWWPGARWHLAANGLLPAGGHRQEWVVLKQCMRTVSTQPLLTPAHRHPAQSHGTQKILSLSLHLCSVSLLQGYQSYRIRGSLYSSMTSS